MGIAQDPVGRLIQFLASGSHRLSNPKSANKRQHRAGLKRPPDSWRLTTLHARSMIWLIAGAALILQCGCGSTTQRTATEQLLLSEAVDNSVNQIDFSPLTGCRVYLDTTPLKAATGQSTINGEYLASALRQKILAARCLLQENRDAADIIIEARCGVLATNGHEVIYGLPASNGLSSLSTIGGGPVLPPIPEMSVGRMNVVAGMSKVAVFAYDRETREPVWQSGTLRAETNSRSMWVFGAGPYVRGNVYDRPRFIESTGPVHQPKYSAVPDRVPIRERHVFQHSAANRAARVADQPAEETPDSSGAVIR